MTDAAETRPPIATQADAETLVRHLMQVMDAMVQTVEQETTLVRDGKLRDASTLEATKSELARLYLSDRNRVKDNLPALTRQVPELLAALRKQHESFQALLQINLTVLATAHAVSEGLIRGVAAEHARKNAPQTYGMSGRKTEPSRDAARPVSVSRTL
jgi:hypothetical protein